MGDSSVMFEELARDMTAEEEALYLEEQRLAMEEDRADYVYFRQRLKDADDNGLGHEFFEGFVNYLKQGDLVSQAICAAAYDWDF